MELKLMCFFFVFLLWKAKTKTGIKMKKQILKFDLYNFFKLHLFQNFYFIKV